MTTKPQPEALPQASDDITQRLLSELAGIDTYDVDLRDNPEAWEAVDRFVLAYATEHAARLHAECEALRAAFNAACAFIDCHVGDWDLTKEMVSNHAAFVKARAELAARAAKEQSNG